MALIGAIASFATGTYTVNRRAVGALDGEGIYVPASPSTFSIEASIQPVTGRDLKAMPDGRHAEELRVVYTITELVTVDPTHGIGDVITYKSEAWEVVKAEIWPDLNGGEFCRAYIARQVVP